MTPAEFTTFAQARHGEHFIQPMADETGYSYAQIYGIAHRGRPVSKGLAAIVSQLPKKPPKRKKRKSAS
jgi:hypothetical protein